MSLHMLFWVEVCFYIWKIRNSRAEGPTYVRALYCPWILWRDGHSHCRRYLHLPSQTLTSVIWLIYFGLWSCQAIVSETMVLFSCQVVCLYHLLGVVVLVGEAKDAPSCCGLAARSSSLRCFRWKLKWQWGACHSGLFQWRSIQQSKFFPGYYKHVGFVDTTRLELPNKEEGLRLYCFTKFSIY